jgi:hypothetical protein
MITAPDGSYILDSRPAWFANAAEPGLWKLEAPFDGRPALIPFPTGIKRGRLISGEAGWFGIWTQSDKLDGFELHACRFDALDRSLARTRWTRTGVGHDGETSAWRHLPPFYLTNVPDFPLAFTLREDGVLHPLNFDWYNDENYDQLYVYPSCLVREPNVGDLIVGMYRSGNIIVCDPETGAKKRQATLPNTYHSSPLISDARSNVLWAMGYDTLFRLRLPELDVLKSRRIQESVYSPEAKMMTGAFVGNMVLQTDHGRICVARPFSGDVLGLDHVSLEPVARAVTGGDPLHLAIVGDEVISRSWKTGDLIRGKLGPFSGARP